MIIARAVVPDLHLPAVTRLFIRHPSGAAVIVEAVTAAAAGVGVETPVVAIVVEVVAAINFLHLHTQPMKEAVFTDLFF